jgi:Cd(II)/Pb(II)-responsive transcriptional regulator
MSRQPTSPPFRIGELARSADCPVETIRYYERQGLLAAPGRSGGNYRLYNDAHLERLRFIRHCRSRDMTHEEIRVLLACRDAPERRCGEVNGLLDQHIGHVTRRIEELKLLADELKQLRARCSGVKATRECGIMRSLGRDSFDGNSDDRHGVLHRTHR